MKKSVKKLKLHKDTLRHLVSDHLSRGVVGGDTTYTICMPCEETDYGCGGGGGGNTALPCPGGLE